MHNVLILGGTGWLGQEIASASLARGDRVTCLARGNSGTVPAGANLVAADRDHPDAYDTLMSTDWDDVVELTYQPNFVTGALAALAGHAGHWTLISTVSVYAANDRTGADESATLLEPVDMNDYGQEKVAAELATLSAVGDRALIARAGLIGGPGDRSDRVGYWVARFASAASESVLVPHTDGRSAQFIDVRDLARWVVDAGAAGVTGIANATGHPVPLEKFFDAARSVSRFSGTTPSAPDDWLLAHGVTYWAGQRSLPLWLPAADVGFAQRSNARYLAMGGRVRDVSETLADSLAWERELGLDRERRAGLDRADERSLLDLLAAQ